MGTKILEMLSTILPLVWAASGSAVVIYVTGLANKIRVYIPRGVQIPLAGILSAIAAGIVDPDAMGQGAALGAALQGALSIPPDVARASARETTQS